MYNFRRAEFGKDLSSWDTSALTSVMLKALLDAKTSHGTPSIAHLTRYYNYTV